MHHIIILMDFHENFTCPLCLQLAKEAVQSSCCTKILCFKCVDEAVKKFGNCPCCRSKQITYQPSRIARKVISEIKVPCEHCEQKVESGSMESHIAKCPKVKMNCRFCGVSLLQAVAPKHTATAHQAQAKQYLTRVVLQLKKEKQVPASKINVQSDPAHNYFKPANNSKGRRATLGMSSKYYCGGELIGKCGCCDGHCGPDNGQNCDACMDLDVKRWKLARTYLVNTAGYICQVLRVQGSPKVCCFRLTSAKQAGLFGKNELTYCKVGEPCSACLQVQNSINIGRYVGLY